MLLCHAFDLMVTVNEKASKEGNKIDRYTDCIVFVTQRLSTIEGKHLLNGSAIGMTTENSFLYVQKRSQCKQKQVEGM